MENQAHKQQRFDSIVACLLKDAGIPEDAIPTMVVHLPKIETVVKHLEALGRVLLTSKSIAEAVGYNGTTRARMGGFRSATRHSRTMAGVEIVKAVESPRRVKDKPLPKGDLKHRILVTLSEAKESLTARELSQRTGLSSKQVCNCLLGLAKKGQILKKEALKEERDHRSTRYLYEVAA